MKKIINNLQDRIRHSKELFKLCNDVGVKRFIFLEKPDKEVYDVFFKGEACNKLPDYTYEYTVYLFMRYIQFYKEHGITSYKFLYRKWKRDFVWLKPIMGSHTLSFFHLLIQDLKWKNDSIVFTPRYFRYAYKRSKENITYLVLEHPSKDLNNIKKSNSNT